MKILVLNGSPRPNGNTAEMVSVFQDAAESNPGIVIEYYLSQHIGLRPEKISSPLY